MLSLGLIIAYVALWDQCFKKNIKMSRHVKLPQRCLTGLRLQRVKYMPEKEREREREREREAEREGEEERKRVERLQHLQ